MLRLSRLFVFLESRVIFSNEPCPKRGETRRFDLHTVRMRRKVKGRVFPTEETAEKKRKSTVPP